MIQFSKCSVTGWISSTAGFGSSQIGRGTCLLKTQLSSTLCSFCSISSFWSSELVA